MDEQVYGRDGKFLPKYLQAARQASEERSPGQLARQECLQALIGPRPESLAEALGVQLKYAVAMLVTAGWFLWPREYLIRAEQFVEQDRERQTQARRTENQMDEHPTNKILDSLRPANGDLPLCGTCRSRLLPSGACSHRRCPQYQEAASGPMRDVDLLMLRDLYSAADSIAKRLESTAEDIRRRAVRSSLDYERRGLLDASGYAADILHDLQSMQGNLSVDRLVRAARDFENTLREEQAKLGGEA